MIIDHNGHRYTVRTNGHDRDLLAADEIPSALLRPGGEFDYLSEDERRDGTPRFVRYRDSWWDVQDSEPSFLPGWNGAYSQTYETAVIWRYATDDCGHIDATGVVMAYAVATGSTPAS